MNVEFLEWEVCDVLDMVPVIGLEVVYLDDEVIEITVW